MNDCKHRDSIFRPCKFEARYNRTPPPPDKMAIFFNALEMTNVLTQKEYICDVCVRCGKTNKESISDGNI